MTLSPQPWDQAGKHPCFVKSPLLCHSITGHLQAAKPVPGARNGCHVVFTVVSTPLSELHSPPGQQAHPDPLSFPWPISCGTFMQLSVLPMLRA